MHDLKAEFESRYHYYPQHIFFSPGRVNLIGEHIDYNGGRVLPCAVSLGTYVAVGRNNTDQFRFQGLNFPETAEIPIARSYNRKGTAWFNYPLGVINEVTQRGNSIGGLDMLFYGNLPIGAGLSSSASIEVLTAYAITELFNLGYKRLDLAVMSKKVENEFMGMNCGIMDQFAVTFGETDRAILLNCDTLVYELLPFQLKDYSLVIINTNKSRKLTDSKYNERFAECQQALSILQRQLQVNFLCDISPEVFEKYKDSLDPVLQKRATHVIYENERVGRAAGLLQANDLEGFGQLMYASHDSLRTLYEVSGKELDTIVDFAG
ncbi:MAG TPA: galactokinase, partial [Chitinophagaceae bacterium]